MVKHKRTLIVIGILIGLAAAAAAAIWHFVWLKPYSITPIELQARYAYKEAFTPGDGHAVHIRLQSFDGALLHGRIVYPVDPARTSRPFPVLIGLHAMGRSHLRWWQTDINGRPTIEQTHRITQMALQQGYAVVAIDARGHGERRHLGQPHLAQRAMRDMHWFGRRQAYEQMIIDTVRDHRVLLDWLVAQPHVDAGRIKAAGYSMGAQGALLLAGLDERVRGVAAMVPPHLGDNVAAVAPINVVAGLQGKRVWLLTGNDDDHATPEQNQALFDAIPTKDKRHLRFDSGHLLPTDYVEKLSDWFKT
ncbi:MAG: dienelactone hydrolase family protein [Burkholderiaceae bacterium]|jgi:dienelactone hydrolase|nr:dienelactone hydrolase family protein [Burkholderiaceae bacterium]